MATTQASTRKPRVLIVGAGIGGLFLAQFLRKRGVPFEIFERDASPTARGSGWALGLSKLDEYKALMPDDVPSLRQSCHLLPLDLPSQFIIYPAPGVRIGVEDTAETPFVRANRGQLRQLMLTGLDVHWDKQAVSVAEDKTKHTVTVTFQDGTAATGDVLIAADGLWSKIRQHVLGRPNDETLQSVPMSMIHGERDVVGAAFEKQLRLGHSAYISVRPGLIFFCGLDRVFADGLGGRFYWFLYYRDDDAASPDQWLRTASRADKYARLLEKTAVLDPRTTEILRLGADGTLDTPGSPDAAGVSDAFSLYYDAIIEHVAAAGSSRIVLLGDAAHPTTPFRGEGGVAAIEDALQLAAVLDVEIRETDDGGFQAALNAAQQEILDRGGAVVQFARDAIKNVNPPKGGPPRSFGYYVRPMPEPADNVKLSGLK